MKVGDKVRIKMPLMTKVRGIRPSRTGTILHIDGAYIQVHPSRWPDNGHYVEFYPNELEPMKTMR